MSNFILIHIMSKDTKYSFKKENAGTRGVYYITVTSTKVNTMLFLVKLIYLRQLF